MPTARLTLACAYIVKPKCSSLISRLLLDLRLKALKHQPSELAFRWVLGSIQSADQGLDFSISHLERQSNQPFDASLGTSLLALSSTPPTEQQRDLYKMSTYCQFS